MSPHPDEALLPVCNGRCLVLVDALEVPAAEGPLQHEVRPQQGNVGLRLQLVLEEADVPSQPRVLLAESEEGPLAREDSFVAAVYRQDVAEGRLEGVAGLLADGEGASPDKENSKCTCDKSTSCERKKN